MIDKRGRKINYLRISLTDKCNLRCVYCMPEEKSNLKTCEERINFEEILKVIKASAALGVNKVRFTGGEPLVVKDIEKLIYETSKVPGIKDISLTTNGLLLSDKLEELKRSGLTRVNISLDTLDEGKYTKITRGGKVIKVKEAIRKCVSLGVKPVKINCVLMRGINDNEIQDFINLTKELPVQVRFIELMPIGEGAKMFKEHFISSKEIIEKHPELIPIDREENATAELYKVEGALGKVGFINPLSCKFCEDCNRIRLTSDGGVKPCLHSEEEFNIKPFIDDETKLVMNLGSIIYNKPSEHHLENENESKSKKMMFQIGG